MKFLQVDDAEDMIKQAKSKPDISSVMVRYHSQIPSFYMSCIGLYGYRMNQDKPIVDVWIIGDVLHPK